MYVIKNALRNIQRAKGRNVLVFTLILVIVISACVALNIKSSADRAKEVSFEELKVTGQIVVDSSKLMNESTTKQDMRELMSKTLPLDEGLAYAEAESVSSHYYTADLGLNGVVIKAYENGSQSSQGPMGASGSFQVTGFNSHSAMTGFTDGSITLAEGVVFEENDTSNNVLISKELAYLNEINVGDKVSLVNPSKEDEIIEVTVSGIFQSESDESIVNNIYMSYDSLNAITTNSALVATEYTDDRTGMEMSTSMPLNVKTTYVFDEPAQYEQFKTDAETMGLDTELFKVVSSDIENYEKSMLPLENLSSFALVFFIVILAIGGIILVVFNLFSIRERKYEMGVLAAIGMQKPKVALQFITEIMVVTLFATVIGVGLGTVVSQPISESLLASQVESAEQETQQIDSNFGGRPEMGEPPGANTNVNVDYVDSLVVSTDFSVLVQLILIGLSLSLLASSVGVISVLRYDPLKILSER